AELSHDAIPEGSSPALTIAALGSLAAVAIPAFMENARRAKSAEAVAGVRKIYDGVARYHAKQHKLPPTTPVTPPLGVCCKGDHKKCGPDPKLWTADGWKAIHYSIDEPHFYSYQIETHDDMFTVRAYGDLDCDG